MSEDKKSKGLKAHKFKPSQSMRVISNEEEEEKLESNTEKQSMTQNIKPGEAIQNPNHTEVELKHLADYSSINSNSEVHKSQNRSSLIQAQTRTSYYVRDQIQPLEGHQTNIEKLLMMFKEQQQQFTDVIFTDQLLNPGLNPRESMQSSRVDPGVIRQLKMSFESIEEIERMKKDSNMYRSTQRNQLGIAKGVTNDSKRSSRLNWIDLFNIGNVMLMRGQDI